MKTNTVTISLDRFKELELAEKKLNEPRSKTIIIQKSFGFESRVETDDECAEILAQKIKRITRLKEEAEKTIRNIKKMNYFDFLKWKKR